ncbi:hypothetical protein [Bacillus sp. FJAT-26390]|uniref:hypothetical protein n=1 Tax=Bacillus sp. FJAT-26390 TaxID=1743142 RepID=UPI000807E9B8|nr:hypothetical protein [Bacillus sp. FJAT-26390]OBZ13344.1 hypothetical protein A7975_10845 [Bacillus sp. FJAT-26390]
MIYKIRGEITTFDGVPVIVAALGVYPLELIVQDVEVNGVDAFSFEAMTVGEEVKTAVFNDLKPFVDRWGGWIDWHFCSHDDPIKKPCAIAETYTRG